MDAVEQFLDRCLSIDNLIDYSSPRAGTRGLPAADPASMENAPAREPRRLRSKGYMDSFINPPAALAAEREDRG